MKMRFFTVINLVLTLSMLSACGNYKAVAPPIELFIPQSQSNEDRCDVILDDAKVKMSDTDATRAGLKLQGSLTSACSDLQILVKPFENTRSIEIYLNTTQLKDPQKASPKPFYIDLPLDSLKRGKYKVTIFFLAYGGQQNKELELTVP